MGYAELLQSGEDSDTIVKVGDRSFNLHSFILKHRSAYFRGQVTSGKSMKEGDGIIELSPGDGCEKSFEAILPFIYDKLIGPLDSLQPEDLYNLFELANYLQLPDFESHMFQTGAQEAWGDADKSPFRSLKACVEEHVKKLGSDNGKIWLLEQCQRAQGMSTPSRPLKKVFLELFCEHCRRCKYFESAYCAMLCFSDGDSVPDGDLEQVKPYSIHYPVMKRDLCFVKTMMEKVFKPSVQEESPLLQANFRKQIKDLNEKLLAAETANGDLSAKNEELQSKLAETMKHLKAIQDLQLEQQSCTPECPMQGAGSTSSQNSSAFSSPRCRR